MKGTSPGAVATPTSSLRAASKTCVSFQAIQFPALTGTLQEVNEVATLWRRGLSSSDAVAPSVLVGAAATERAFKQQASGHRVLHLATHGFFLGESCSLAPGGTRGVGGLALSKPAATKAENPLLLSGLALAGANRRQAARPDEDDGILMAEEVAALNLENVEWAVLSACEQESASESWGRRIRIAARVSGGGRSHGHHEPVVGRRSGDARLDASTHQPLSESPQHGRCRARCEREVLRSRRAAGRSTNPFFWAAFVAVGDWR